MNENEQPASHVIAPQESYGWSQSFPVAHTYSRTNEPYWYMPGDEGEDRRCECSKLEGATVIVRTTHHAVERGKVYELVQCAACGSVFANLTQHESEVYH